MQKLNICLWFDNKAEEAANFYVNTFRNGRLGRINRYGEAGAEVSGRPQGSVMTVEFELFGQQFLALNGGPEFKFSEAMSIIVNCETQREVDDLWTALSKGGGQESVCGWLKDKYGVSWQITPTQLTELMHDKDAAKAERVMKAMLQMKKIDIEKLQEAARGR
jgi:predicted 3-demethylubiquinone-9 3-methyltransferase (glyoxalase superfamily)